MDVALWKFSDYPPSSDSMDDALTFLIMLHSTCTGTFSKGIACIGVLDFGPRKKYPTALITASGYDMLDASKYMWRIIPLLLYSFTSSVCVAL